MKDVVNICNDNPQNRVEKSLETNQDYEDGSEETNVEWVMEEVKQEYQEEKAETEK